MSEFSHSFSGNAPPKNRWNQNNLNLKKNNSVIALIVTLMLVINIKRENNSLILSAIKPKKNNIVIAESCMASYRKWKH